MNNLFFATGNPEKVKEAHSILGIPIEIAEIDIDEVQSMDLEYVATKKAEAAFGKVGKPVLVDDVGFQINAWNGFPGPLVKHLLKTVGNKGFLKMLENEQNRSVKVQSIIAYCNGNSTKTFLGEFDGILAREERGNDGWGFDFIVIPNGEDKTLAELGFDHKNKISHRALAFFKAKEFFDSQKI